MRCLRAHPLAAVAILVGCGAENARGIPPVRPPAAPAIADAGVADASPEAAAPSAPRTPARGVGKRIAEVRVLDDARFWVVADGRAFETRDGGATFVDRTPFAPVPESDAQSVWSLLASPSEVFLLRGDDELARWMTLFVSKDGGAAFTQRRVPRLRGGRDARLERGPTAGSLLVLRSDGGGMNSHATSVLETRDAGVTFRVLGTVTGYGEPTFQTRTSWWSVGTCCASASSIYRSPDAGLTWKLVAEPTDGWEPVSAFVFIDGSRGYRVVRGGEALAIERTTDGGRSTSRATPPSTAAELLGADRDACVVLGEGGEPMVTRDMGASWSSLAPLPEGVFGTTIARTPHGWLLTADAGGTASALFVLHDGAGSWEELSPSWS